MHFPYAPTRRQNWDQYLSPDGRSRLHAVYFQVLNMHFQYCQKGRADQAEVFGPVDNTELPLPAALKPEALALRLFKIIT